MITRPGTHTRGAFARKKHATVRNVLVTCDATDPDAVCFCASGALRAVYGVVEMGRAPEGTPYRVSHDLLAAASRVLMRMNKLGDERNCITVINDSMGQAGALQMYNMAIMAAKGK